MLQFLKDSVRELKHVVWPTRKDTQKYFFLVTAMLMVFGLYLFAFSNIFSNIVFGLKDIFGTENTSVNRSISNNELDALFSAEATVDVKTGTGESVETENKEGEVSK